VLDADSPITILSGILSRVLENLIGTAIFLAALWAVLTLIWHGAGFRDDDY